MAEKMNLEKFSFLNEGDQDSIAINWNGIGKWDDQNGDDPDFASPFICQHTRFKTGYLKRQIKSVM